MNGEYLRKLPVPELIQAAEAFLKAAGLSEVPAESLKRAVSLEHEKYKLLSDVPARVEFFFKDVVFTEKALDKVLRAPGASEVLLGLADDLRDFAPFTEKPLEERIRKFCAERNLKAGQVFHPLRAACTGRTEGPTLFLMLEMMGKELVLSRLKAAVTALK